MANILIFTTRYDKSVKLFPPAKIYNYKHLSIKNGKLHFNNKHLLITKNQKIILRDPYNTGVDYSPFLQFLIHNYFMQICLDPNFLYKNPYYEDKLQQSNIFHDLQLPTPQTFWTPHLADNLLKISFPCLLKKRYSSRSRYLRKLFSWEDYQQYFASKIKARFSDYLIQELITVAKDWRVLVFKGKILGAMRRQTAWKENGRVSLIIKKAVAEKEIPTKIRQQIKQLVDFLQIDFAGIDIIFDPSGQHYFLECNFSPQFRAFVKVTGIKPQFDKFS